MASKPKEAGSPANPLVSAAMTEDGGLAKFTWNLKGKNESLTIRCDSEEELTALRDKWKAIFLPTKRELPKLLPGDDCTEEKCNGHFVVKTTNGKPGQKPYAFLSCSNFPTCKATAYIKEKETQNGQPERATGEVARAQTAA